MDISTDYSGCTGVWVAYQVGMHTGHRDNDFYATHLAVFLEEDDARIHAVSHNAKVLFLPFGRMLRRGFEAADVTNFRYMFPISDVSDGQVWFVAHSGQPFGSGGELTDVMFFPSVKTAEAYASVRKHFAGEIRKVQFNRNYVR